MNLSTLSVILGCLLPLLMTQANCSIQQDSAEVTICPDSCQCHDQRLQCRTLPDPISMITQETKSITIEQDLDCGLPTVKELIQQAYSANIEVIGNCKSINQRRKRSLKDLMNELPASSRVDSIGDLQRAGFDQMYSTYGFNETSAYAINCQFTNSTCGWSQPKYIDFLDWQQGAGIFLIYNKTYNDGRFADLISPPLMLTPNTTDISYTFQAQTSGIIYSSVSIYVMYPLYDAKKYLVNKYSFTNTNGGYSSRSGTFKPAYSNYRIVISGRPGVINSGNPPGRFTIINFNSWPNVKTCVFGNGQYYRGAISNSQSGSACRNWNDVSSSHTSQNYPNADLTSNKCRNPGASRSKPWCYTSQGWEYCNIATCGTMAMPTNPPYPLGSTLPVAITPLDNHDSRTIGQAGIYVNGTWHRICYFWDYSHAISHAPSLMCKKTGLGQVGTIHGRAFAPTYAPCIRPSDINCPSTATTFSECSITRIISPLRGSSSAWIACYSGPPPQSALSSERYILSIDSSGQSDSNAGIAKIQINDNGQTSGGFCKSTWGLNEADVFCRQAGYLGASSSPVSLPSSTSDPLGLIKSIKCLGYETRLSQCTVDVASTPAKCPDSGRSVATVRCIPHMKYYYSNNQPSNCKFTSGLCGWKSIGNVPGIWRQNDFTIPYKPTLSVISDGGYLFFIRSPYYTKPDGYSYYQSPILYSYRFGSVNIAFDHYIGGAVANTTVSVNFDSDTGASTTEQRLIPSYGWSRYGPFNRGFSPKGKFTARIGVRWNYRGPPSTFIYALDNVFIYGALRYNVNGSATVTIPPTTVDMTTSTAVGRFQAMPMFLSFITTLMALIAYL